MRTNFHVPAVFSHLIRWLRGEQAQSRESDSAVVFDGHSQVKLASKLAKEKRINDAISVLHDVYINGFADESNLIKILPYYQKAGRYSELRTFCQNTAVPLIKQLNNNLLEHKCDEIKDCFFNLSMNKLYGKMALCAEREGASSDLDEYLSLAKHHASEYERLLPIGEAIEWGHGKLHMTNTFGSNIDNWPDPAKSTYKFDSYRQYKASITAP